ncbi:unnamed protein product [Moneuplotes crassus]|uniref:Uncharacterized protein n=1 Tax=Euplotes crassus TaxID=5936 RepID=A0AAD1Y1W2_EUPCR|nr:unnamed protein product [Moneuplotes crassus]|mmetsp:Transcript_7430/g.6954  ORF Transcript_7430/g.6954 Transcript_7430/m.6954 type:complete len:161 (-) Transcript_7430:29-511(-)
MQYTSPQIQTSSVDSGSWVHYLNIISVLVATFELLVTHPWNNPAEVMAGLLLAGTLAASAVHHLDEGARQCRSFQRWAKVIAGLTLGFYLIFLVVFLTSGRFPPELILSPKFLVYTSSTILAPFTLLVMMTSKLEQRQPVQVMTLSQNLSPKQENVNLMA